MYRLLYWTGRLIIEVHWVIDRTNSRMYDFGDRLIDWSFDKMISKMEEKENQDVS